MGLVALQPKKKEYAVEDSALKGTNASIDFFIACWPILDPKARYQMAKNEGKERLVDAHHSYFPQETDMVVGNPYMVLDSGQHTHMPPMAIVQAQKTKTSITFELICSQIFIEKQEVRSNYINFPANRMHL